MTSSSDQKEPVVERSPGEEPDDPTGRALRLRIRQQELLAELGVLALQGTSFIEMLNHTARITAEGLRQNTVKLWNTFRPRTGCWFVQVSDGMRESSGTPPSGPIWHLQQAMP